MKRIVALAGALALAACGSGEAPEEGQAAAAAPPAAAPASSLAGTYGASGADGQPWTSALNANGTYRNTVAGQLSESGRWSHRDDQLCFQPEALAGEVPTETCLTLLNVNDDGSLVLADAEGNETTAPRLAR